MNPYSVNYTPLKRARLPVPPLSHIDLFLEEGIAFRNIGIILQKFANVNTFFEKSLKYSYTWRVFAAFFFVSPSKNQVLPKRDSFFLAKLSGVCYNLLVGR